MRSTLLRAYGPFRSGQGGPFSALSLVQRTPESPPPACRLTPSADIVLRTGRLTKCKSRRPLGEVLADSQAGFPETRLSVNTLRISGIHSETGVRRRPPIPRPYLPSRHAAPKAGLRSCAGASSGFAFGHCAWACTHQGRIITTKIGSSGLALDPPCFLQLQAALKVQQHESQSIQPESTRRTSRRACRPARRSGPRRRAGR